jgi:hypothetical protein
MSVSMIKNTFLHLTEEKTEDIRRSQTLPELDLSYLEDLSESIKSRVSISSLATDIASDIDSIPSATSASSGRMSLCNDMEPEQYTTVMVRNIPCKYNQLQMIEEVSQVNPNFNFLYVPPARTVRVEKNLGYSFVNFNTPQDAQQFMDVFAGHEFSLYKNSPKKAIVSYADLQGFEENINFFKKSKVSKTKFRPFIAA